MMIKNKEEETTTTSTTTRRRRMRKKCELCNNSEASIYCPSDSAFLCSNCDSTVHHANFLVARHLRYSISSKRHRFIPSTLPSSSSSSYATSSKKNTIDTTNNNNNNTNTTTPLTTTPSLSSVITNGTSSSSSVIITSSDPINRISFCDIKRCLINLTEGNINNVTKQCSINRIGRSINNNNNNYCSLFEKWSMELELEGVNGNFVTSFATRALSFCLGKWKGLPFRVAAATSFWFGVRFFFGQLQLVEDPNLITRLEHISGVPAKLIVAAHAKLARVFTLHRRQYYYYCNNSNSNLPQQKKEEAQEGWDES